MLSDETVKTKIDEQIKGKIPCQFPDRPVTKFIPTRYIMHQLLFEAVVNHNPDIEKEIMEIKVKKK